MMNFTLTSALLLCSFSWILISGSESQTVEVQPGEDVTLLCANISRGPTHTFWSRLVNRTKISCISSTFESDGYVESCDGFKNGKFEMGSNTSTVSLKIKKVDLSDSGLYFCGLYKDGRTLINVIHLNVQGNDESHNDVEDECEKKPDGITNLTSVILGGLPVFLVMVIIGLVVKNRKLQTAGNEEQRPQRHENVGSDDLKDAALTFRPTTIRSRRPASEREVETCVLYATSR